MIELKDDFGKLINEKFIDLASHLFYEEADEYSNILPSFEVVQSYLDDSLQSYVYELLNDRVKITAMEERYDMVQNDLYNLKKHNPNFQKNTLRKAFKNKVLKNDKSRELNSFELSLFDQLIHAYNKCFPNHIEILSTELERLPSKTVKPILEKTNKVKFDLTVAEIAALFKVFYNSDLIIKKDVVNQIKYSEIHTFIQKSISSKEKEDISDNTIRNHFGNPQIKTLKSLKGYLLRTIQETNNLIEMIEEKERKKNT